MGTFDVYRYNVDDVETNTVLVLQATPVTSRTASPAGLSSCT